MTKANKVNGRSQRSKVGIKPLSRSSFSGLSPENPCRGFDTAAGGEKSFQRRGGTMRDAADRTGSRVPSSRKTWFSANFFTVPMPASAERSAGNSIAQAVLEPSALIRHAALRLQGGEWESTFIHVLAAWGNLRPFSLGDAGSRRRAPGEDRCRAGGDNVSPLGDEPPSPGLEAQAESGNA